MSKQRQYWVVSPNVKFEEKTVADWKKEILRTHAAIMGYDSRHSTGRRFADDVRPGDIILIARRHNWAPDVVGLGVAIGECKERRFRIADAPVYVHELSPFMSLEEEPEGIPLISVLQHTIALRQLHPNPEKKDTAWQVCRWMERLLEEQESDADTTAERGLSKSNTYGYKVRTTKQVRKARKREKELLDEYEQWLRKQERNLSLLSYGRLECDAWEGERRNLIEAKGSTSREDIRMAVGQLLDYAFQMRRKSEDLNKAVLLPEEPPPDRVKWLAPLGIKVIWRRGQSFLDNANGQFT